MDKDKIATIVNNFKNIKILVIGDLLLDHYISGNIKRLNPEEYGSPLLEVEKHFDVIGGAANAASNISSLGATSFLYGIVGDDESGRKIIALATSNGIIPRIMVVPRRMTPRKTRLISTKRKRQIARYDEENIRELSKEQTKDFIRMFKDSDLENADVYLISDYAKGFMNKEILNFLKKNAKRRSKLIISQHKPSNKDIYYGVDKMINMKEATEISELSSNNIHDIGKHIVSKYKCNLIITYGKDGMGFYGKDKKYKYAPTKPVEAYDETGAGDTAFAVLCIALASKLKITESMDIANHASGIVVKKVGTATLSPEELIESYNN
jgi:D-glycero-beta-D-manno-heptose-7-phosphate kinase